ncbi:uncharacterized protein B0T15DRAFT_37118 [Chaetomium strumarium]|uniref:Uncharacterized protein n=1 Tax=Chaetomium strumarium TaxID=1170767 RepID=A0AAJ0M618_9PEZI|nr:hypothetical protein B0T15DRAFT_37118 [Chaetomium strumarium]
MSAESLPITPARFAAALKDLPVSSLHLKLAELRNSIAHLDYSNEQLRPYAEGTAVAVPPSSSQQQQQQPPQSQSDDDQQQQSQPQQRGEPDQDCIDAIRENEEVIERMQERIRLVRAEVESRGLSWAEFQAEDSNDNDNNNKAAAEEEEEEGGGERSGPMVNGNGGGGAEGMVNGASAVGRDEEGERRHSAWTDGTFQTGVIRNGELHMDAVAGSRRGQGGSLTDEELRRRMEEQLRGLGGNEDDEEGGLHL